MLFSSFAFLFLFLPIALCLYEFVPEERRNLVLLVSSLVFYATAGLRGLPLIAFEAFVGWVCAARIESSRTPAARKTWLVAGLLALLGLLGYFKYWGLLASSLKLIFGPSVDIARPLAPLGISFYTLSLVSYLADVYRGKVSAQRSYRKLLLFCSLFHCAFAGPIVRYETIAQEIDHRSVEAADVYAGVRRFCAGLAKKAVLANGCAVLADSLVPSGTGALAPQPLFAWWLGMLAYMLQVYLDLSAYADMAIGLGRMVGFRYSENFDYPYLCTSVREFCRRWFVSLGAFLRDYVYLPLGGSRGSAQQFVRNLAVVCLLGATLYGAGWNYLLWGAYCFVLLVFEHFWLGDRLPLWAGHAYTLVVVLFGWVIFRFESFPEMGLAFAGMFGFAATGLSSPAVGAAFLDNAPLLLLSGLACTNVGPWIRHRLAVRARLSDVNLFLYNAEEFVVPVALLLVSTVALAGANFGPFVYFRF